MPQLGRNPGDPCMNIYGAVSTFETNQEDEDPNSKGECGWMVVVV